MIYYKCIELFRNLLVRSSRVIGGDITLPMSMEYCQLFMSAPKFIKLVQLEGSTVIYTMWRSENSVSCSVKDSVTVHVKEDDYLSEPSTHHMSTSWSVDWVSCQVLSDLRTSNILDTNVVDVINLN